MPAITKFDWAAFLREHPGERRIYRSRWDLLLEIAGWVALAASLAYALAWWPRLPARVPIHFGLRGPDGWGHKGVILVIYLIGASVGALTRATQACVRFLNFPVAVHAGNAGVQLGLMHQLMVRMRAFLLCLFAALGWMMVRNGLGHPVWHPAFLFLPLAIAPLIIIPYLWAASRAGGIRAGSAP